MELRNSNYVKTQNPKSCLQNLKSCLQNSKSCLHLPQKLLAKFEKLLAKIRKLLAKIKKLPAKFTRCGFHAYPVPCAELYHVPESLSGSGNSFRAIRL